MLDKETLIRGSGLPEADVELEGFGTARIRALTRAQGNDVAAASNHAEMERRVLAYGLVEPAMSIQDVKRWQEQSTVMGPIDTLIKAITGLSGMDGKETEKEIVQRFPD